jgi:hypothetical protein
MKLGIRALRAISLAALAAIALSACNGESKDDEEEDEDTASSSSSGAPIPGLPAMNGVQRPTAWFPPNWDQRASQAGAQATDADRTNATQQMYSVVPLQLFILGNDTELDENFQPAWVWWTALRSCEKGVQLVEDLSGEFGDRARGAASLTAAKNELRQYAATQPQEITLRFVAVLGQWDPNTGLFPISSVDVVSGVDPVKAEEALKGDSLQGGSVSIGNNDEGSFLNSITMRDYRFNCPGKAENTTQSFSLQINASINFGTPVTQYGQIRFVEPPKLPPLHMERDAAAAFAQSNAERKVLVTVTTAATRPSYVRYGSQLIIPGSLRKVVITNASNNTVIAQQDYAAPAPAPAATGTAPPT